MICKLYEKYKEYITPFRIVYLLIALTIFFVTLFLGIVPFGKWWAYLIFFGVIVIFLGFMFPKKVKGLFSRIFR